MCGTIPPFESWGVELGGPLLLFCGEYIAGGGVGEEFRCPAGKAPPAPLCGSPPGSVDTVVSESG